MGVGGHGQRQASRAGPRAALNMKNWVRRAERLVADTPIEPLAKWAWKRAHAVGRPRVRQSLRYDSQARKVLKRVLRPDANCVDIGAHQGSFLKHFLSLSPDGTHFAFEPLPELATQIERRFPSVNVHALALSDGAGERAFCHVMGDPGQSGFERMNHVSTDARVEWIRVPTARLDDVLPPGLPIAFIKIDVEGAQYEVLKGAGETITSSHPYIVFEHGALARESYGTTSEVMYDLLVGEYGLRLSLMRSWLAEGPPLGRTEFVGHVGHHATSHFTFLAHR